MAGRLYPLRRLERYRADRAAVSGLLRIRVLLEWPESWRLSRRRAFLYLTVNVVNS